MTTDDLTRMHEHNGKQEIISWLKMKASASTSKLTELCAGSCKHSITIDSDENSELPTPKRKPKVSGGRYQSHLNKLSQV